MDKEDKYVISYRASGCKFVPIVVIEPESQITTPQQVLDWYANTRGFDLKDLRCRRVPCHVFQNKSKE